MAAATSSANRASSAVPPHAAAAPIRASSATAVIKRVRSTLKLSWSGQGRFNAAESAFATGEPPERDLQLVGVEVRPQHVGEVQLGMRHLTTQEIHYAEVPTGADHKVQDC